MRTRTLITIISVAAGSLAACASSSPTDPGLAGGGTGIVTLDKNPYGVAYPAKNVGTIGSAHDPAKMDLGKRGSIISNFKFYGYPGAATAGGLKPVQLADYYDPEGKLGIKLIHLQGAGVWCTYCQTEMELLKQVQGDLKAKGVVLITILAEGDTGGKPATQQDLLGWIEKHKPSYTQLLDPGSKNVGVFFDANAMPWNAFIDPRTMEILRSGVGLKPGSTKEDVVREMDEWLAFLDKYSAAVMP